MRADVIGKRRMQVHARPVDRAIASGVSMESKLIWQYLTSNRPIHCRRTLDQYGYPSLRNTSVRDSDQILYKRTRPPRPEIEPHELPREHITGKLRANKIPVDQQVELDRKEGASKVLMVDQLWLWVVDQRMFCTLSFIRSQALYTSRSLSQTASTRDERMMSSVLSKLTGYIETVITFAAPKEKEDLDIRWELGDLRSSIYQDVNGDYARQCDDCFDFAALVVFHAVKAMLDITDDDSLQVFRIFEEYISILVGIATFINFGRC